MSLERSSDGYQSSQSPVDLRQSQSNKPPSQQSKTENGQALGRTKADREEFFTFLNSLPCIGFTLNSAQTILSVSQLGAACLGYNALELTQKSISQVIYWEDKVTCQAKLTKIQQQPNQIHQWETRLVRQNGSLLWVRAKASMVAIGESQSVISLVCEDITQCKQAEEALRQSEARFQAIVEGSLDAFFLFRCVRDETGSIENFRVVDLNSNGEKLIAMSTEVAMGKMLSELPPIHHTVDFFDRCVRVVDTGEALEEEFPVTLVGVSSSWRRQQVMPLADGVVITSRDITKRRQAEEALQQQFLKERLVAAIAQRIHQSLNLEEILNTTVAEVRQFLVCDRVIIFRIHEDGSGVIVVESVDAGWDSISGTSIHDCYFAQMYIRLYQQGRVQAVEDIDKAGLTDCHRDLLARFQVRANLVVPIVHEEKLWGLLVAQQCREPRKWQPLEIDLLSSLATQAAIAIQQSELYQQAQTEIIQRQQVEEALRQQFQREHLVGAMTTRIRQSLNLEEILDATAAEVRQVLHTDRVVIFRFKPDWSGNIVVESVASSRFSILGRNIYDPCFKQAYIIPYQQGRVRAIEDIHTADLDQCHRNLLAELQVRANLVVPILHSEQTLPNAKSQHHNRLWGLLVAHHCTEPRKWQQYETDLLISLASQVAIAIQQSQLYQQAQYQAQREQALNQLTQAIRCSLDLQTIFSTATREIEQLLKVDRTQIVQYLPEKKLWMNVAESCQGMCSPISINLEIPDENNPLIEKLKRLEVVRIDDTNSLEDEINQRIAQLFPGAWLLVPLHFSGGVWGALALMMNRGPYPWQDSEVELICEVADQLAIALQQAELYEQSRTATAQAQTQAQQLEQTLLELQKTQAHLVQSEKMSSLGQLVAGVAHEINNPVSFIYGNLVHAREYTHDLLGLIELYQQQYPEPTPEVESEIEAIDLKFLMADLPKLLDSMRVGAERICEIVAALRNFSRLAEAEMKAVDLHDGLDSTLMILHNRLRAQGEHPEIQVIKEYGDLPKVECYAGQLNQVFMNLLTNALDAIDEQNQKRSLDEIKNHPSFVRIRTELLNEHEVAIRIADNGPGMTEEVKTRLFDPFFTTKPVGTGTGLGLSISYQIVVKKHGGQFYCNSQLGKGTEFVIRIPISQDSENS